ncbi:hypothetical protein Tco_0445426 [Tanacetum coccineum]
MVHNFFGVMEVEHDIENMTLEDYLKYEPKRRKGKSTGISSENSNINTSNSYSALENEEEEDEKHVENVYDESANLFPNSKTGESLSFTAAAG